MSNETKSSIKIGVVLSYVNILMTIIIALIYIPFVLKELGQNEFGLYSIAFSAIMLLSIFDLGLGNTNIRYIAKYRSSNDHQQESMLHGTSFILYSFIGGIILLLGIALSSRTDSIFGKNINAEDIPKLKLMLQFVTVSLAISFPLNVFKYVVLGYERFLFIKSAELIRTLLIPIISVILLLFGFKSVALIITIAALNIFFSLLNLFYSLKYLNIKFSFQIDSHFIKELFFYSLWVFLGSMTYQLNNNINPFILGIVAGTTQVAIYALGFNLVINLQTVSFSISSILLPTVTRLSLDENYTKKYNDFFITIGRLQYFGLALFIMGFFFFGKEFISLWAGSDYKNSYYIVMIVILPLSIFLVQSVGITILQAQNKHKFSSVIFLCMVLLNILTSFVLSKYYGAIGAAISIASAWLLGHGIIMNIFYYKKIKIDVIAFWKQIFSISKYFVFPIIFAVLYLYFYNAESWLNLALGVILFTLIYLISISFSFNNFEKNFILKPIIEKLKKYGIG